VTISHRTSSMYITVHLVNIQQLC